MSKGKFHDFYLEYGIDPDRDKDYKRQAEAILKRCSELVGNGTKGVGITYSANYDQTRDIEKVYSAGGWFTDTHGEDQASVIKAMEVLLGSECKELQGKMHILPITTMNGYVKPVHPWNENEHLNIVITDLDRINKYLEDGWDVLGWQNQDNNSDKDPNNPYAIGGRISGKLPKSVSDKIQGTLIRYHDNYPE